MSLRTTADNTLHGQKNRPPRCQRTSTRLQIEQLGERLLLTGFAGLTGLHPELPDHRPDSLVISEHQESQLQDGSHHRFDSTTEVIEISGPLNGNQLVADGAHSLVLDGAHAVHPTDSLPDVINQGTWDEDEEIAGRAVDGLVVDGSSTINSQVAIDAVFIDLHDERGEIAHTMIQPAVSPQVHRGVIVGNPGKADLSVETELADAPQVNRAIIVGDPGNAK